jgi:hypothetical protein
MDPAKKIFGLPLLVTTPMMAGQTEGHRSKRLFHTIQNELLKCLSIVLSMPFLRQMGPAPLSLLNEINT